MVEYVLDEDVVVRHEKDMEPLEIYIKRLRNWQPYAKLYGDLEFRRTLTAEEARAWLLRKGVPAADVRKAVP